MWIVKISAATVGNVTFISLVVSLAEKEQLGLVSKQGTTNQITQM